MNMKMNEIILLGTCFLISNFCLFFFFTLNQEGRVSLGQAPRQGYTHVAHVLFVVGRGRSSTRSSKTGVVFESPV